MNGIYKAYICVCIITTMSILHVWYWNNAAVKCKGKHCLTTPTNIIHEYDATKKNKIDTEIANDISHDFSFQTQVSPQTAPYKEAFIQKSPTTDQQNTKFVSAPTDEADKKVQTESEKILSTTLVEQTVSHAQKNDGFSKEVPVIRKPANKTSYLIYDEGCKIPKIDPFDKAVRPYFKKKKPYKCNRPAIVTVHGKTIHINRDLLAKSLQKPKQHIQCAAHAIHRIGDGKTDDEFMTKVIHPNINDSYITTEEFVKISCSVKRKVVYEDFFPFIHKKPQVEQRCNKVDKVTLNGAHPKLNVVMVGLDSISSNNFRRHFPKSYHFIKAQMKAIELQGYLKLGDNTFPCLTPMLTGKFVNELKLRVKDEPFDNSAFIWEDYSQRGYRTLFAEDFPEIAIFNYAKKGFFDQPTDYYLRPFYLAAEQSAMRLDSEKHCFHSRMEVTIVWQWLQNFMAMFQKEPIFALSFVTHLTHDYLNNAGYADKPFYEFLSSSVSKGYLNNTVLVLFSDHGIRFGSFRQTYVGQLEERHPFLFLSFPPWFAKQYPNSYQNLKFNENRLVTMFDVHQTLKDLLSLNGTEPHDAPTEKERGISLFNKIPTGRTCYDAAIQPQWCTCYNRQLVTSIDDEMMRAAHFLVSSINKLTERVREDCALLILHNVTSMYMSIVGPNQGAPNGQNAIDYFVIVETVPGKGLFEGTIWYNSNTNQFDLMGGISRVNRYKDQSWCVDDFLLKKLCYCNQKKRTRPLPH